tara:strand:- start:779 stop:1072 length:294 start_codon:yes stop_codon:yes gene_type:complete
MSGKYTFKSIDEAAKYFSLSTSTIRNWIKDGRLPAHCYFKAGGVYRIALELAETALMPKELEAPEAPLEPTLDSEEVKLPTDNAALSSILDEYEEDL